jgi:hypothetical protein
MPFSTRSTVVPVKCILRPDPFWGAADLIAEGAYVVGRWEGGGTHTGPAFSDFLVGSLAAGSDLLRGSVVLVSRPGGRCLPVVAER